MSSTQQPAETASTAPTLNEKSSGVPADEPKLEEGGTPAAAPKPGMQVPDGGWEAWSVVIAGWLILFCTFGFVNAYGSLQVYYVRALEKSDSQVAWIGSFQLWLQFSAGLVVGKVFDEGYGKALVVGGSALYILCVYMTSLCKEYWQVFLAQGLGMGLGLGILFLPAISVIPQWFGRKRALATGIVVSGSSVGGIVFPIMINKLIDSHGYAFAVRACAYIITGCLVIAASLIKFRIPGRKHRPAHMQLPPPDFKSIMTHKTYWVTIVAIFLIMWGLFLPIFFMQVFAELNGIDTNLAFYLLSILNAASVFGRIVPNFLADRFGCFNLLTSVSSCAAILIFVFPLATSKGSIIVFALLYGFFSGAYVSLIPGCMTSLSSNFGEIGVRIGFANAIVSIAALTGSPIDGALLGSGPFHWWKPVGFSGAVVAAGSVVLFVARTMHAREKGTNKV
ncbi:major facilitator superfamily domain-containing protein [Auriculariales sp. MPI-PUGE-AT-0066]|nr:major facilitator superfamily domain-containing protein [Auriculariales sp. MPI-PUGE-AT-0066]